MVSLIIPEYRPDLNDLNKPFTQNILNVSSQGDGYGPVMSQEEITAALGANCRGYYHAINYTDGSIRLFAGTEDKIYLLNNTTLEFEDVSQALGSYTALSLDEHWKPASF